MTSAGRSERRELRNPFLGLTPFTREESHVFFGRERDAVLIEARLMSNRATILFAGSGVGKSSFLRSKLIPDLEADYNILYHNRWSGPDPIVTLRRCMGIRDDGSPELKTLFPKGRGLLIFDQVEELFQYHRDDSTLPQFVKEVAKLIDRRQPVDLRLLLTIREEFLGELSIFDGPVPEVFGNYYRLRNLSYEQARTVIERTAEVSEVACDPHGLDRLLIDLRRSSITPDRVMDVVAPPYLQIVSHRIWEATRHELNNKPFLFSYEEGRARRELQSFCEEKLEALTQTQQEIASDACGFLMSKRGAKMAYAASDLARLLSLENDVGNPESALIRTLRHLVAARVLREFADSEQNPWFELYHDMYAPFLMEWKAKFDAEKRIRRDEVGDWEAKTKPLRSFWVYLPKFLLTRDNKFFQTMLDNFENKDTQYVYILRGRGELLKLLELVEDFEAEVAKNGRSRKIAVRKMIKVLVLGVDDKEDGDRGTVLSNMLHLNNYWIANGEDQENGPDGYEVEWDATGDEVVGGVRLKPGKLKRVVRIIREFFEKYPPQDLEGITKDNIEKVLLKSPIRQLELINSPPSPKETA